MSTQADIEVSDQGLLLRVSGPTSSHLKLIGQELDVSLGLRGNTIRISGDGVAVKEAQRVVTELVDVMSTGQDMSPSEVARAIRTLTAHADIRLKDLFDDVILTTSQRRIIAPKGVAQQRYVHAIRSHDVVFGVGPAGTGKTYLAMAMAVGALQQKRVKRIILTRPAVEAGERLGFLPGDLAEKVNPYLRPLYDAMHDMMDAEQVDALMQYGTIEVAPLAFMRGRTLNDAFVILDEAQNTTVQQMKMFLTRLGYGTKTVVTGDVTQTDLPRGNRSGLADALHLLRETEGIAFREFSDADVVRHPLVQRIIRAYDNRDARRRAADRSDKDNLSQ